MSRGSTAVLQPQHCCHGILFFAYCWCMLFFIYGKNRIKKPCTYVEGFEPLTSCLFVRLRGECFTAVLQPLPHYSSFCLSSVTKLFNIKMGHSWSLFLYFRLLYLNELVAKILPMSGFEAGISGVRSNRSTNWATIVASVTKLLIIGKYHGKYQWSTLRLGFWH